MIRVFDLLISFLALVLLFPFFLVMAFLILLDSRGGVFYLQSRVGRNNRDFRLIKFRTMKKDSDRQGQLTIGSSDQRITATGRFLRKYKLDELPQLVNVLKGDMSLVGPRPEVRKYVDLYTEEQRSVLNVRPGITDYASLEYFEENDLLAASPDPEKTYIERIMPAKLELNRKYLEDRGPGTYFRILGKTMVRIFR
ncbi:MAG TPA: sugar transferase [Bacteroidales bacterium]|nr:sugar transferase [Bacteroidales bacterium]